MRILVTTTLLLTLLGQATLFAILANKQKSSPFHWLFTIYIGSILLWTTLLLLNLHAHDPFIERALFAAAALAVTAQFWFAKLYPYPIKPLRWYDYWSPIVGLGFFIISFFDGAVFSKLTIVDYYGIVENGYASAAYSVFILSFSVAPVAFFLRKRARTNEVALRSQFALLALGFFAFLCVSIITNSILPVFFDIHFLNSIGPVFSLILAATVFYLVWQYKFLDIRIIVQRGLIYIPLLVLVIAAYLGILPLFINIVPMHIAAPLLGFFLTIVSMFIIYGIEHYFHHQSLLEKERAYTLELERTVAERTAHLEMLRTHSQQMLGDIAHALQTPLTVLTAALEPVMHADGHTAVAARHSIDAFSSFVRDLLRLARMDTAPTNTHTIVDFSALVFDTAEYVNTICIEQKITLTSHIEEALCVTGSEKDLRELITILLSNAIRYMNLGPNRSITITLIRTNDTATLSISDTGIGISPDKLPYVFERLYRAHGTGTSGNGLGLAIAKRIVEQHNGTITAESAPGRGTTVTVTLSLL